MIAKGRAAHVPAPERRNAPLPRGLLAKRKGRRPARPGARKSGAGERQLAGERVLIVEDDVLTAWHLRSMAEDLELDVCGVVGSGDEAVEKAAELGPAVVLMDISLGDGIDGIEAARRILRQRRVAVVFVTAYSDRRTMDRIVEAVGEARVVPKPVNQERLRKTIAAALSGNRH